MKIRTGFVSNSSSSSFLMYGVQTDNLLQIVKPELLEEYKKMYQDQEEFQYYEFADWLTGKTNGIGSWNPYDGESGFYFGLNWDYVEDDETGLQFKKRVQEEINKILNVKQSQFDTHQQAWYG